MENTKTPLLSVSDFIALTNQTLEYAYSGIAVEGEIASFTTNQNKYVFFDLKDETGTINCFMMAWQLRVPIEDGMKAIIVGQPKLTDKGRFSLTVRTVRPSGTGSIKRSFDILKEKLLKEGLFSQERKRELPELPSHIAVVSSTDAAGYADFVKILNDRWGGLRIDVAHVQVQGKEAPDQIIRAIKHLNGLEVLPEIIVLIRGGGSRDDLSAFNDEILVREIAASRIPTLVGVGHETDTTLADLAADVRAATPSNAAELLIPSKHELLNRIHYRMQTSVKRVVGEIADQREQLDIKLNEAYNLIVQKQNRYDEELKSRNRLLTELDPNRALRRGYAIIRGVINPGEEIMIQMEQKRITAEVKDVKNN